MSGGDRGTAWLLRRSRELDTMVLTVKSMAKTKWKFHADRKALYAGPDYGIGIVGKWPKYKVK